MLEPAVFGALDDSCWLVDLLRLLLFFLPPAALTERSNTPLALKKATRKGCLDWGPFLPMIPADFMLILRPWGKKQKVNKTFKIKELNWIFDHFITAFNCELEHETLLLLVVQKTIKILAIHGLHTKLQAQILLWVHHPVVTGCRDVKY